MQFTINTITGTVEILESLSIVQLEELVRICKSIDSDKEWKFVGKTITVIEKVCYPQTNPFTQPLGIPLSPYYKNPPFYVPEGSPYTVTCDTNSTNNQSIH